ncbi:DUF1799 domain-containing protein [Gibbsiella quercinecans]|uniref:DUF1799 domain-containing protein n=1 Tax=Gibbsiella quercinecans TaxID=929813 RepID=UPI003C6D040B
MREFGLRRSDYEEDLVQVQFSEDMIESWEVFLAMSTQWRHGFNGPTGLDYNVLPMILKAYKIADEEMVINDVRILEGESLKQIRKLNS